MVPPLALIFLVLGTIFIGVATPTEGGAMGAAGALMLAMMKRRLTFDLTRQAIESTAKLSAFVVFILVGARVFSLTFYGVDGHRWVEELLVSLPGGQIGFLIFVNVFVFLLAFFLDFFEIAFIVIPLLGPAAERLGIDLIWFGVMLGVNMQTSFMHPPFGFALFYLRSVAPREPYIDRVTGKLTEPVTTGQIYWGAVPFVIIQCIMVALVIAFPAHGDALQEHGHRRRSVQGEDRDSRCPTCCRRSTSARQPSSSNRKSPGAMLRGLSFSGARCDASGARAHAHHEAVEAELGDLHPGDTSRCGRRRGCRSSFLKFGLVLRSARRRLRCAAL